MTTTRVPGRPRSIPTEHFDTVLKLYAAGEGYRRIAKQLVLQQRLKSISRLTAYSDQCERPPMISETMRLPAKPKAFVV